MKGVGHPLYIPQQVVQNKRGHAFFVGGLRRSHLRNQERIPNGALRNSKTSKCSKYGVTMISRVAATAAASAAAGAAIEFFGAA